MNKKVLVLIVTYNGQQWLDFCLRPLLECPSIDLLCVDNASTDDTVSMLKREYPSVRCVESPQNLGFGKANNIGMKVFEEEGYDYLFLLNQDARITVDSLYALVDVAESNKQIGIVSPIHCSKGFKELDFNFSQYLEPNNTPRMISDSVLSNEKPKYYETGFVNAALWLMTRECVVRAGGFNPVFLHYGEDTDYCRVVKSMGLKIVIASAVQAEHVREHPSLRKAASHFSGAENRYYSKLMTKYVTYRFRSPVDMLKLFRDVVVRTFSACLSFDARQVLLELKTYVKICRALKNLNH